MALSSSSINGVGALTARATLFVGALTARATLFNQCVGTLAARGQSSKIVTIRALYRDPMPLTVTGRHLGTVHHYQATLKVSGMQSVINPFWEKSTQKVGGIHRISYLRPSLWSTDRFPGLERQRGSSPYLLI